MRMSLCSISYPVWYIWLVRVEGRRQVERREKSCWCKCWYVLCASSSICIKQSRELGSPLERGRSRIHSLPRIDD